jgi:predicted acetyltransferase
LASWTTRTSHPARRRHASATIKSCSATVKLDMHWMMRVLEVAKALEARG